MSEATLREAFLQELPICPETGFRVLRYETSDLHGGWKPELPKGWLVFDDRMEGHDPESQKWHESDRVMRVGPRSEVLTASAAQVPGVTFTPAG